MDLFLRTKIMKITNLLVNKIEFFNLKLCKIIIFFKKNIIGESKIDN